MDSLNQSPISVQGPSWALEENLDWDTLLSQLSTHLLVKYSITVNDITKLDQNIVRIDSENGTFVARIFSSSLSLASIIQDAELLRFLEQQEFPSERFAHPEPVSTMNSGHHVLLTIFIDGRRPQKGVRLFSRLGSLLGQLHVLEYPANGVAAKKGGSWHHLCHSGDIKDEIQAALTLMDEKSPSSIDEEIDLYDNLRHKVAEADDFSDLPHCLVHPDFVPSNSIVSAADASIQIVDWSGAGIGPRIVSLGFLLWAAGMRSSAQVNEVISAYKIHVSLEEDELSRLDHAIMSKPVILRVWEFCTGRRTLMDTIRAIEEIEIKAAHISGVATRSFRATDTQD